MNDLYNKVLQVFDCNNLSFTDKCDKVIYLLATQKGSLHCSLEFLLYLCIEYTDRKSSDRVITQEKGVILDMIRLIQMWNEDK